MFLGFTPPPPLQILDPAPQCGIFPVTYQGWNRVLALMMVNHKRSLDNHVRFRQDVDFFYSIRDFWQQKNSRYEHIDHVRKKKKDSCPFYYIEKYYPRRTSGPTSFFFFFFFFFGGGGGLCTFFLDRVQKRSSMTTYQPQMTIFV